MSEAEKCKRFPPQSWDVLEEIVLQRDGGKYAEFLKNRDCSANMAKFDMWIVITRMFNEV
jgi:hypothetical protein